MTTSTFNVDIVSMEQTIFSGKSSAVFVTGAVGELGIYPGHTALLSSIKPGYVRLLLEGNEEELFFIDGGFIEVQPKKVTILADTMRRAADIDEQAALEAKERAEKLMSEKQPDVDQAKLLAELNVAIAQLKILEFIRKKVKS